MPDVVVPRQALQVASFTSAVRKWLMIRARVVSSRAAILTSFRIVDRPESLD